MSDFGNGIGGIGGGISDFGGGSTDNDEHLTVYKEISLGASANRKVETWQGPFDRLLDKAKQYKIGKYVEDSELPEGGSDTQGGAYGYAFVSDVKLSRSEGGIGRLVVTYTQNRHVVYASVDFTEVQRPIKTWRANGQHGPDLAAIREWEAKKDTDYNAYSNFSGIEDGTNTKKLAEMIFKGIESYSVYVPVVTFTATTFSFPQSNLVKLGGVSDDPKFPYPWDLAHGLSQSEISREFRKEGNTEYKWVLASSRTTPNADGTYQWVLQYQACDDVEEVLFE